MSDFTGRYDQHYGEYRNEDKGNVCKCDITDCDKLAVYAYNSKRLCVDHYMELKG